MFFKTVLLLFAFKIGNLFVTFVKMEIIRHDSNVAFSSEALI
jgi:hypothetical protein